MQIASPLYRVICINWRRDAGAAPKMTAAAHALEKTLSSKLTRAASLTMRRKTIRSRDSRIRFVTHLPAFAARSWFFLLGELFKSGSSVSAVCLVLHQSLLFKLLPVA
jgi:hypothetical protein